MIMTVGIPVSSKVQSVNIGYSLRTLGLFPANVSAYWTAIAEPFELFAEVPIHSKKRRSVDESDGNGYDDEQNEKYEKHQVEADIVESGTETNQNENNLLDMIYNLASSRWLLYKSLAEMAERLVSFCSLIEFVQK